MALQPYRILFAGLLAVLPVVALIGFLELVLFRSGETANVSSVARQIERTGPPAAFMRMFLDQGFTRYRFEQLRDRKPEVIVLGSSRGNRFRKEMFSNNLGFYNAAQFGVPLRFLDSLFTVLALDGYTPKAALIAVDSYWFNMQNSSLRDNNSQAAAMLLDDAFKLTAHLHACRELIWSIVRGHMSLRLVADILFALDHGVKRYGMLAWTTYGFRNDGSLQSFDRTTPKSFVDREQPPIVERVRKGQMQFVPTLYPDSSLVDEFERTLKALDRRGCFIAGFAPPFSSAVLKAIADDSLQHSYFEGYKKCVVELFARHGWPFVDASDPRAFGFDDRCMMDGFHAMETFHIALLGELARNEHARAAFHLDTAELSSLMRDPKRTSWYPWYNGR